MPLTSDTNQSMSLEQIRTEFFGASYTGSISMNQLYRGGTYVDSTKEVTDGISSISASGFGQGGYTARANAPGGDLNTTTGQTGFYGGCFPYQYGFLKNAQQINPNLCQSTHHEYPISYIWNGTVRSHQPDTILTYGGTCGEGNNVEHVMECTMGRDGDYYIWGYDLDSTATLKVEIDTGSGYSTVYGPSAQGGVALRHSATGIESGDKIKLTMAASNNHMSFHAWISTSSSTNTDETINVNTSIPDGTPGNETISLGDFYGGENA